MARSRSSNNASNALLMIAVIMLCMIFMANAWVSHEIEETKKIGTPAAPAASLSPRRNLLAHDRSAYARSDPLSETSSQEVASYQKTQKRKKIIYEIPLDDVNLVQ